MRCQNGFNREVNLFAASIVSTRQKIAMFGCSEWMYLNVLMSEVSDLPSSHVVNTLIFGSLHVTRSPDLGSASRVTWTVTCHKSPEHGDSFSLSISFLQFPCTMYMNPLFVIKFNRQKRIVIERWVDLWRTTTVATGVSSRYRRRVSWRAWSR